MAVFNPVMVKTETGLLVPGEEYVGFLPERLDETSAGATTVSVAANSLAATGGYLILQDYQQFVPYFIIPGINKGESAQLILTGSDSSKGVVNLSRSTLSISSKNIVISCADSSKPVSLYVKAYGYGGMGNKTSSGGSQALQTVKVTITGFGAYYTNANQELVAIPYPNPSPTEVYDVLKGSIIVGLGGATIFNTTLTRLSPYAAAAENDGLITFNPASGG